MKKVGGCTLVLISFGIPWLGHKIKPNYMKLQTVNPEKCSISIF